MQKSKFRKGLVVAVIVLFVGASVVPSTGMVEKSNIGRAILYVGGSGPGNYTTIQSAINAASNGDTVFVYNGTYNENVNINKDGIILIGESELGTIINSDSGTSTVTINNPNVQVSNFTISKDVTTGDALEINPGGDYTTIENCTLKDGDQAVNIRNGVIYTTITYCDVRDSDIRGILTEGDYLTVTYSDIHDNIGIGIRLAAPTNNCNVYSNNFYNNTGDNAEDDSFWNKWDNGVDEGNYWDDYTGEDSNGDGIGDIPYNISGGSNQDLYPLMYPWYPTHPDTVYVDDDYDNSTPGFGYDRFDRIQYGINEVEGSTVYVYSGTYNEGLIIDKSNLILIGEDIDSTIIDANGLPDGLYVTKNNFSIINFTIRNGYQDGIVIRSSSNCEINNCILYNFSFQGIVLYSYTDGEANNNSISNCSIFNNGKNGIRLYGRYNDMKSNRIVDSNVFSNSEHGIIFDGDYQKDFNIVSGNKITSNNIRGIDLHFSSNNIIENNNISSNNGNGICFSDSSSNTITDNIITNNNDGIDFEYYSNNNTINYNIISSNNQNGIEFYISSSNLIYHNNLIDNGQNAYDDGTNAWDNGYPSGGNYWSDYTEDDLYNGPNQDIPGQDGIGDTPYNISGGDSRDNYPLMHPFEIYYILNISAPPEVNEGESFNILIKSEGGTAIPNATVEFNDELKLTDSDGRAYFTAPQVGADTSYDIIANKEGYTGDTETILVKDVPAEFVSTFILGRIDNLTTGGDVITFEAVNIWCMTLFPFNFNGYNSGELITISKNPKGFVGALFGVQLIFAFCGLAYQPSTSTISMNKFSQDDFANTVIWLVSGVEGPPVETKDVEMILLNESGQPQPDAEITFNEVNVEGYINPGDTFTVVAPSDGYYVFMLTHKISGATIYKSSLTHY